MMPLEVLGTFPDPPAPPLSAVDLDVIPIDLVTEWRRCGMIADFMADYMVSGFERGDAARSVLSTILNELVENAAKFSVEKRTPTRISIRNHGAVVHAEIRSATDARHLEELGEVLAELLRDEPKEVFRRRLEDRRGLGLALLARDYGATVGATVEQNGVNGRITVCLRVSLSAAEVEQR